MKNLIEVVNDEALALLIGGVTSCQDRACILLALGCGLRLGELASLNVGSVVGLTSSTGSGFPHTAGWVRVETRHRFNRVPVGPAALAAVQDYLAMRDTTSGDVPLFIASSGTRLTRGQIAKRLRRVCRRLGLPPISYQALRYTFFGHCVAGGLNLVAFKQLMDYASWADSYSRFHAVTEAAKAC